MSTVFLWFVLKSVGPVITSLREENKIINCFAVAIFAHSLIKPITY